MSQPVDTRPFWAILLSKIYRPAVFAFVIILFLFIIKMPTPDGLTEEGQRAIAVFSVCLILWVTSLIPLQITSLLAIILLPLMGIMDSKKAYSLFGNEAVFFILGEFILAAAMMASGLSTRLALAVLSRFDKTPKSLLLAMFLFPAFLSFLMSEHAVAAMMFPITLEIAKSLKLSTNDSNYGKAIFLAPTWGVIIGGVATFLGGARNPLAVGILKETTGQSIGFFEWMIAVVPTVMVMLCIAFFLLLKFFKPEIDDIKNAREVLEHKNKELGNLSKNEKGIAILMVITIFCWIFFGEKIGLANIAIAAVVLTFVFKLVKWKHVEQYVNWGIILMYGGAIALGFGIEKSGAAQWAASVTISSFVTSPFFVIIILSSLSLLLTEGVSNSAVVAILMPVGISIAKSYNIDPKIITLIIAVPSGLDFCLPMGTPANAIAYSSGYIKLKDLLVPGAVLGIVSLLVFLLMVKFYWPMLGMNI